jgi:hypothetical protein
MSKLDFFTESIKSLFEETSLATISEDTQMDGARDLYRRRVRC